MPALGEFLHFSINTHLEGSEDTDLHSTSD